MLGLKEIYSAYCNSVKEPLPKELFTTLIQEFNLEVVNRLLEGEAFNMRNHLSNICINKSAYRFTPSRGLKGNKEKLTKLLKTNELAYLRFQTYGNK